MSGTKSKGRMKGDGREQHAAHAHRRRRVERAIVGGDQVLDEGQLAGKPPELRPEVAAHALLPLGEVAKEISLPNAALRRSLALSKVAIAPSLTGKRTS